MKKVMILGIDGYIGYALAIKLLDEGYEVSGLDNYSRRTHVDLIHGNSLTPIQQPLDRERFLKSYPNFNGEVAKINLRDFYLLSRVLKHYRPDAIVHLAEQPSAPWSMRSASNSIDTQYENVIGTLALLWAMREQCPSAHLIKLGTMGEYGTPNCDIPEGEIPEDCLDKCMEVTEAIYGEIEKEEVCKCPMSGLLFPRQPNSFYHASKVHDTYNIDFACRNWGLRSTDIMQGVVFGVGNTDDPRKMTRFDYDQYFGTCINRFVAQALINHPLTIYGQGGQVRSFLPLADSLQCLKISIDNPPSEGEYRTFNQFENFYKISMLAVLVHEIAEKLGLDAPIANLSNPRYEIENHYYNTTNDKLISLGYEPTSNIESQIELMMKSLLQFKDRIKPGVILPTTTWK